MPLEAVNRQVVVFARQSAVCALVGALLSAPLALPLVAAIAPQPPWRDPAAFAAHYHPVQAFPYFAGFLLVGGFVALVAALDVMAREADRARTRTALACAAAFAGLVLLNYTLQTTFVPALLSSGSPESVSLAAGLTMANPRSLGWALEMWGYAVLGVATWLVAPVLRDLRWGSLTAALYVANGPASVLAAVATAIWPGWVLGTAGLVGFAAWNLLILVMLALTVGGLRAQGR